MNNANPNPSALLRSLIVYAICVPLAMVVGYALVNAANTNLHDTQSLALMGALAGVLVFPLLMKWHYPLLVFSWGFPITLFFLPGKPNLFLLMVLVSLTISAVERILSRNRPFVSAAAVKWPLVVLLGVVFLTAKLTGGFGLRSMGSDVYGGKKYVYLVAGILSFFAITARPIAKKDANFYMGLYFVGGLFSVISDLYPFVPSPLHFIFYFFPPAGNLMDAYGNPDLQLGVTRLSGVSAAAGLAFNWMLCRYGFRDNVLTSKLWRPAVLCLTFMLIFLGGYRSGILDIFIVVGVIFYLERLHRTGLMAVVLVAGITLGALLVPLAPNLPYTFQRSLAFLPLDISPAAKMDAQGSTEWRLEIWEALMPQIPQYLLLGKGYAFAPETFNESMGWDAEFLKTIDAGENSLALSSDFHSGPLSVIISFGIWGVIAWLWFWAAGFWVVLRNYRYGDPNLGHINCFLLAAFLSKCFAFLFIIGSIVSDMPTFAGIIGLSVAINHGVMRPRPRTSPARATAPPHPALAPQPAFQR